MIKREEGEREMIWRQRNRMIKREEEEERERIKRQRNRTIKREEEERGHEDIETEL